MQKEKINVECRAISETDAMFFEVAVEGQVINRGCEKSLVAEGASNYLHRIIHTILMELEAKACSE